MWSLHSGCLHLPFLQEAVLEKDNRCLAETHYQLGLAHCFSDNFDDAVTHFRAAVDVIQLKIKNLKARVEEKNTWSKERKDKESEYLQ